ncbi:hypothetical protein D9619_001213 [Psilocybe cf. subviscida]|uniref:Uncharacterized protein n=1 Tax=Psilocybe cf. subviscida TaxID=2480587 RepID=A0A8H5BG55_9AGAR|nr:hypothetical protein D9619_001213 [Psilocybe cf. subviscida]
MLECVWMKHEDEASGSEADIASYVFSMALRDDSDNHCVETYEVLRHPGDSEDALDIHVMPLLRPFNSQRLETVGKGVELFQQAPGRSVHRSIMASPFTTPVFFRSLGTDKSVPWFNGRYTDTTPFDPFARYILPGKSDQNLLA